jgi:uncharacterized protein (TIGR01244 family)
MNTITFITPGFAVTGELSPSDFPDLAARGFKTVINNRPDGESEGQMPASKQEEIARQNGLEYVHVPTTQRELFTDGVIGAMADAMAHRPGPILAHCKSGMRSSILWAVVSARTTPVADVLATLQSQGIDLSFLHDELEQQAARHPSA